MKRHLLYAARRQRRCWLYRSGWDGPPVMVGDDEYGRRTLVFRLPGHRAFVWAFWTCRCNHCDESREDTYRWAADPEGAAYQEFAQMASRSAGGAR